MKKFWNWMKNEDTGATELYFEGPISAETCLGDEITPGLFKSELEQHPGDLTVWICSPGGDVFAASQIYTMLRNHKGKITVKIDALAASAASVVAMSGDETFISPTGMLMVHDKAVARLIQGIPQKGLISGLFADGRPMRSYFFALPPVR